MSGRQKVIRYGFSPINAVVMGLSCFKELFNVLIICQLVNENDRLVKFHKKLDRVRHICYNIYRKYFQSTYKSKIIIYY